MNTYYKQFWNETREDEFNSWGSSIWFFEVGADNFPIRQLELYENGNRLKYHDSKPFDDFGGLGDQALETTNLITINKNEFEIEWLKSNPKRKHQQILDLISEYLSMYYDQRFGQALFNLKINEFIDKTTSTEENFVLRDIYNDSDDEIIERIQKQIEHFTNQRKR